MKIIILSPKCTQESAKYITEELTRLLPEHTFNYINPYKTPIPNTDFIINWGVSGTFGLVPGLNNSRAVLTAVDKIFTFQYLADKFTVPWAVHRLSAKNWINEGHHVVIRETSTGNRSQGITITNKIEDIDNKPAVLYTKYEPHFYELRVNCWRNEILTILEKKDKNGVFEFKLLKGKPHKELQALVNHVYTRIGLDICGLDVILTENNEFKLLEVNSAPMLFGKTGQLVVEKIIEEIKYREV